MRNLINTVGPENVNAYLKPPKTTSWKTLPHPGFIQQMGSLLEDYLNVAPNTVVPGKKHRAAIIAVNKWQKILIPKKTAKQPPSDEDMADDMDALIRAVLGQLREMKQSVDWPPEKSKYRKTMAKANSEEQAVIEKLLALCSVMGRPI